MILCKKNLFLKALPNIIFYTIWLLVVIPLFCVHSANSHFNNYWDNFADYVQLFFLVLIGLTIFFNLYCLVCLIMDVVGTNIQSYSGFLSYSSNFSRSYTIKIESQGNVLKLKSLLSFKKYKDKYVRVYFGELSKKVFFVEEA